MYCNLSKTQALPMGFRVSTHQFSGFNPPKVSKIQSFSNGFYPKPSLNPRNNGFDGPRLNKPRNMTFKFGGLFAEFALPNSQLKGVRSFSSMYNGGHRDGEVRGRKNLPWLEVSGQVKESKPARKVVKGKASGSSSNGSSSSKSSWEISAEKFMKKSGGPSVEDEGGRSRTVNVTEEWGKPRVRSDERNGGNGGDEGIRSRMVNVVEDWRKPGFRRDERNEGNGRDEGRWSRMVNVVEDWRKPSFGRDGRNEGNGEDEVVEDPRWDKIKTRAGRVVDNRVGSDRPEMRRWNREENWGRKTFREASESSLPKMVGESLYGVGPVLAALSAGRREFYTLYVQKGLESSKPNKKRKDKKGFEKVLKIAEKIGLSVREVSKHDLNMVADNRPHQGLVLDTSPLEMVNIKELETVSTEHDKGVLWVALDEVTDPQNLGAIIRSTYFFGATGVVLCAKNSAPLSGVVSKASAGSLELMEVRSCKNMMQFLTSSSENGWHVVGGSVSSRAVPVHDVAPGEPTILVLGSEGTGLRPLVERSCTQLVRIPGNIPFDVASGRFEDDSVEEHQSSGEEFQSFMAVESLNVSVAAGVLLHHFIGSNYISSNQEGNVDNNALD